MALVSVTIGCSVENFMFLFKVRHLEPGSNFLLTNALYSSGLHQRVNVTVIAATNRPDNIDPALLRPGILCLTL